MKHASSTFLLCLILLLTGLSLSARQLPNFNLLDTRENNLELYGARGKAVVLFFTGTGCPIARKSVATLKNLEAEYTAKGVDFWIINSYADESPHVTRALGAFEARVISFVAPPGPRKCAI